MRDTVAEPEDDTDELERCPNKFCQHAMLLHERTEDQEFCLIPGCRCLNLYVQVAP